MDRGDHRDGRIAQLPQDGVFPVGVPFPFSQPPPVPMDGDGADDDQIDGGEFRQGQFPAVFPKPRKTGSPAFFAGGNPFGTHLDEPGL